MMEKGIEMCFLVKKKKKNTHPCLKEKRLGEKKLRENKNRVQHLNIVFENCFIIFYKHMLFLI